MKLLRRSTALLLSCAIVLGLVASGFLIRAIADTAMQWYNADYDALSRFYEIGASYDPGIIATTPGDPGGKSYGMYMFASNAGVPHDFAEWCKKSDKSVYRDIGDALDSAYHRISDGYGSYFDATWQDMANTYKGTFGQAQYDYTKDKFYNKVVSLVENKVDGFDIDEYSVALKNVFFIDMDVAKMEEIFAPGEIDRLFINFPDPWPRKKNAKRRLTHRTFLDKYCRTVREGGEIHFKTDNAPLFAYSLEEFAACGLEVKNVTHDLHKDGIVGIMTGYEEKFHALGTPINRCEIVCRPFVLPPEEKKQTEGQEEA